MVVILVSLRWFVLQVDPIFSSQGKSRLITVHQGESLCARSGSTSPRTTSSPRPSPFASTTSSRARSWCSRAPTSCARVRPSRTCARCLHGPSRPGGDRVARAHPARGGASIVARRRATPTPTHSPRTRPPTSRRAPTPTGSSLEGLIGDRTYLILPSTTPEDLARDDGGALQPRGGRERA